MNIFVVDDCPEKSARSLCDKHVVKMILESAQMMSTTHRVLDGEEYYDLSKNNRRIKDGNCPTQEKKHSGRQLL